MRLVASALAFGTLAAALLGGRVAHAGSMDPATERLVLQPANAPGSCQAIAGNPELAIQAGKSPNSFPCKPDNVAFANVISELGFAIAPTAFHPARTTGIGGFALTLEASYTKINSDAVSTGSDGSTRQYWHDGTRGPTDPATGAFSTKNADPVSILQIYSLKARKGLPFGFEVTGALGYLANSSMWNVGADIRWAPLEGFRTGVLGVLPDFSVGGGVRTLLGTDKFTLTTVGLDFQLSKPIAISGAQVLTPVVGFQRIWVFGDSSIIDSTPNTDPINQCGYQGIDKTNGSPVCKNTLSNGAPANGDFNNNFVFSKVRTQRNRLILGLNYRYEMLYLAGQVLFDLTSPQADSQEILQPTRQWQMSYEIGAFF
ncbi:hypothetical protein BH09MYX1_BH09MYX1_45030 [soil metagenome]